MPASLGLGRIWQRLRYLYRGKRTDVEMLHDLIWCDFRLLCLSMIMNASLASVAVYEFYNCPLFAWLTPLSSSFHFYTSSCVYKVQYHLIGSIAML